MSKIRIRNFGPIKEGLLENDGWMEIKKVTVFIGNQGSGKSTVAKVISTLSWLEKSINRGDINKGDLTFAHVFEHFKFQGIRDYFLPDTSIEYQGDKYLIELIRKEKIPIVRDVRKSIYNVPKIMYIPAERNFLSTIEEANKLTGLPEHLFAFAEELKKAQKQLFRGKVDLPIQNYAYEYDKQKEQSFVSGRNHRVNLLYASSGFQSIVPLFLVTRYLTNLVLDKKLSPRERLSVNQSIRMNEELANISLDNTITKEEKQKMIGNVKLKYINKCVVNVIEEPEQNLFPTSQRYILNSLLNFNNRYSANKLMLTTHSPYIINYLTLAVKAYLVCKKYQHERVSDSNSQKSKIDRIVPLTSLVKPEDLVIYEFGDNNGRIKILENYKGLPSDENYLNSNLEDSNELFAQLQEIERGWR